MENVINKCILFYLAQVNGNFPNHNISTLDIQMSLAWNNNECTLEEFPLTTTKPGNIIFYR